MINVITTYQKDILKEKSAYKVSMAFQNVLCVLAHANFLI